MKILIIGKVGLDDLSFLVHLSGHEIEWFDTRKLPQFKCNYKATYSLIKNALSRKYDLIISGNKLLRLFSRERNIVSNYCSLILRFLIYPNRYGAYIVSKICKETTFILIDREDAFLVNEDRFSLIKRSDLFFKREMPQNIINAFVTASHTVTSRRGTYEMIRSSNIVKKFLPISLGIKYQADYDRFLSKTKTIDIFFAGKVDDSGTYMNVRKSGIKWLQELQNEGIAVELWEPVLSQEEFMEKCASSYMVWSPEGQGWDCHRHYEAAIMGSVPVMNYPFTIRYAPFEEGVHGLYYAIEGRSLKNVVKTALQDKDRLIRMGKAARQHVLRYHTFDALCKYVINSTLPSDLGKGI